MQLSPRKANAAIVPSQYMLTAPNRSEMEPSNSLAPVRVTNVVTGRLWQRSTAVKPTAIVRAAVIREAFAERVRRPTLGSDATGELSH